MSIYISFLGDYYIHIGVGSGVVCSTVMGKYQSLEE